MYELRRVYATLPGEERRVASLLVEMGEVLLEAGLRAPSTVSFNGGTCPGEKQRVYMTWTTEKIESTFRAGNVQPERYVELRTQRDQYTTDTWLQITEVMTAEKRVG